MHAIVNRFSLFSSCALAQYTRAGIAVVPHKGALLPLKERCQHKHCQRTLVMLQSGLALGQGPFVLLPGGQMPMVPKLMKAELKRVGITQTGVTAAQGAR